MNRLALYCVLLAGFGPALGIVAQPVVPPHNPTHAWSYVCENFEYDCTGIAPPYVVWAYQLMTNTGQPALGMYDGGESIFMSVSELRYADPVSIDWVLAHEMAHYLDVQLGVIELPFTKDNACASEMRAWRVGNAYALTHGRADLVDYSWFERYGCFR